MHSSLPLTLIPILSVIPIVTSAHPIPIQLALSYQHQDVSRYLVSEKYDGIRCYWDGKQLWTRHGHLIHAPTSFIADFPTQPLDGELWIDYQHFSAVEKLIAQQHTTAQQWQNVHYMVFDLPRDRAIFKIRYQHLKALLNHSSSAHITLVEQYPLLNAQQLNQRLAHVIAHHGEGLVLHLKLGLYQAGRSGHLLKLKPADDAEATIIGYRKGHGKYRGMTGALIVKMSDGRTFAIGSGLTDKLRAHPPVIGTRITFRYNGLTRHHLPRFPRYLRRYSAL